MANEQFHAKIMPFKYSVHDFGDPVMQDFVGLVPLQLPNYLCVTHV